MGRTVKRVPLDFEWSIDKIWKGYINPYYSEECSLCDGTGYNGDARLLKEKWYGNDREPEWVWMDSGRRYNKNAWMYNLDKDDVAALIKADRLWDFTRVPCTEEQRELVRKKKEAGGNSWLPENNGYVPTPNEVNAWSRKGLGHDSLNCHIVIEARLKKYGLSTQCEQCHGEGSFWLNEETKELFEQWEREEPPLGEGYQLWETTTEGSPQSPVFKTLGRLCLWCEKNATTFGSYRASATEWEKMFLDGCVYHEEKGNIFL